MCYKAGKSNVDADALSRIEWNNEIQSEAVKAILKAVVEDPGALAEVHACHLKACPPLVTQDTPPNQVAQQD